MTWMDQFKSEHPDLAESYIVAEFCPTDGMVAPCPTDDRGETLECVDCWYRQIPEKWMKPAKE